MLVGSLATGSISFFLSLFLTHLLTYLLTCFSVSFFGVWDRLRATPLMPGGPNMVLGLAEVVEGMNVCLRCLTE